MDGFRLFHGSNGGAFSQPMGRNTENCFRLREGSSYLFPRLGVLVILQSISRRAMADKEKGHHTNRKRKKYLSFCTTRRNPKGSDGGPLRKCSPLPLDLWYRHL